MLSLGMWRLRGCPRCKGDITLQRDHWGRYEQCIQCGYLHDLENAVEVKGQGLQCKEGLYRSVTLAVEVHTSILGEESIEESRRG